MERPRLNANRHTRTQTAGKRSWLGVYAGDTGSQRVLKFAALQVAANKYKRAVTFFVHRPHRTLREFVRLVHPLQSGVVPLLYKAATVRRMTAVEHCNHQHCWCVVPHNNTLPASVGGPHAQPRAHEWACLQSVHPIVPGDMQHALGSVQLYHSRLVVAVGPV